MLCVFDDGGYRMDVLALDSPTADLHRAPRATVLRGCNWPDEDHARGRVAQLYGGYILPGSTWSRLFLMVSQWNSAHQLALPLDAVRGRRVGAPGVIAACGG